jgi:hypothetical protein
VPRILAELDENERASFLRDLSDEVSRRLKGETTYDIRNGYPATTSRG